MTESGKEETIRTWAASKFVADADVTKLLFTRIAGIPTGATRVTLLKVNVSNAVVGEKIAE